MTDRKRKMKVELWPIDKVQPSPSNPKFHPPAQVENLAESMREFGWTAPLLVAKDGDLLAGHGRLQAALRLELDQVPVIVADGLSDQERRAFRIGDNRLAELGFWDSPVLASEVSDLMGAEFDVTLLAFTDTQLSRMLDDDRQDPEEDAAPPLEDEAVSATGDIWIMGDHPLACGDSTSAKDAARACGKHKPVVMVTDPPYGVGYQPEWRAESGVAPPSISQGKVANDDVADWAAAWEHFAGSVAYVWHADAFADVVCDSLEASGYRIDGQIVWRKFKHAIGRGNYSYAHENLVYCVQPRRKVRWNSGVAQGTVWRIRWNLRERTEHSTQKPVECMRRPIRHSSLPGDSVYDPFMGSGSTLIACELTGRISVGLEINPLYVDMAVRRWQERTGREAVHEASGESFTRREQALIESRKPSRKRKRKGPPDGKAR